MNLACIEDLLENRRQIHPKILIAHPLKAFFMSRNVSQRKLAKALGVSPMSINYWLNGRHPIPPKRMVELDELVQKILDSEARTGKRFGT
jgi:transcriptional regulator with XRE-family HTH domain